MTTTVKYTVRTTKPKSLRDFLGASIGKPTYQLLRDGKVIRTYYVWDRKDVNHIADMLNREVNKWRQ